MSPASAAQLRSVSPATAAVRHNLDKLEESFYTVPRTNLSPGPVLPPPSVTTYLAATSRVQSHACDIFWLEQLLKYNF